MIEIQTFVLMFELRVLFRTFIFIFWRDGVCGHNKKGGYEEPFYADTRMTVFNYVERC